MVNLTVMVWIAMTVSINYYLISFLAVTFSRPYLQVLFSTLAEIVAYATSGLLFKCLGAKPSLFLSLAISASSGLAICLSKPAICLVMLAKFGISATYNIQLCTLVHVYPSSFLATGFGIGHFFGVLFQISTPFIAAMQEPLPIGIFSALSTLAALITPFLRINVAAKQ